jgi:hypothetical protein
MVQVPLKIICGIRLLWPFLLRLKLEAPPPTTYTVLEMLALETGSMNESEQVFS